MGVLNTEVSILPYWAAVYFLLRLTSNTKAFYAPRLARALLRSSKLKQKTGVFYALVALKAPALIGVLKSYFTAKHFPRIVCGVGCGKPFAWPAAIKNIRFQQAAAGFSYSSTSTRSLPRLSGVSVASLWRMRWIAQPLSRLRNDASSPSSKLSCSVL